MSLREGAGATLSSDTRPTWVPGRGVALCGEFVGHEPAADPGVSYISIDEAFSDDFAPVVALLSGQ